MQIKDRVAIVTGAASGIGKATCEELVNRGVKCMALVDLSESVHELAAEVNAAAGAEVARGFVGDVVSPEFRGEVFDTLCREYGAVHICVPCAGIFRDRYAVKIDRETGTPDIYPPEMFRQVLEVNLMHPIYWAMELVARMGESRHGKGLKSWHPDEGVQGTIIFIGSVASQGNKGQISYASTKAGLEGAASTLMKESMFHGVRTAVIHPGFVDTPMLRAMPEGYLDKHVLPDTQLKRLIKTEEIADAICFMISNSAVSGELWADAGWHPAAA